MPVAPILVTGELKPPIGAYLDRIHPLAQGLVYYILPGLSNPAELVTGGTGTLLANGAWTGVTRRGSGLISTSNTDGGAYWPWAESLANITTAFTIAISAKITSIGQDQKLLCIPAHSTWAFPYNCLSVEDTVNYWGQVGWWNGSNRLTSRVEIDNYWMINSFATYVITADGSYPKFYRDGRLFGSGQNSFNTAVNWVDKRPVHVMQRNAGDPGEGVQGTVDFVGIWNRALTLTEIQQINVDPFTILVSPSLRRWWTIGQAAGNVLVAPDAVSATHSTVNPTVILGSLSITPAALTATRGVLDPGVVLGSLAVTPSAVSALGSVVNPAVIQSSMTVSPAVLTANGGVADPQVILGSLSLTPTPLAVNGSVVNPGVVQSSIAVTPVAVSANGSTENPTVLDGSTVGGRQGLGRQAFDLLRRFGW